VTAFGKALREARNLQGKSLREVASKLGISAPYLSDVERGNRAPLKPGRIKKAAVVLNADLSQLLALADLARCPGCVEKAGRIAELEARLELLQNDRDAREGEALRAIEIRET
jgi:transcriptional regulator with XRE-family HTH domain